MFVIDGRGRRGGCFLRVRVLLSVARLVAVARLASGVYERALMIEINWLAHARMHAYRFFFVEKPKAWAGGRRR